MAILSQTNLPRHRAPTAPPQVPPSALPLISPHPSGSDLRCDHHQREWILDLILEDIVLEVEAQHVDDEYDSDESCEFGDPDPYDEFIADPFEVSAEVIRHGQPLLGHELEPMDDGGARPPLADTGPTPSTAETSGATT